jgi:hypothetical protein
MKSLPLTRKSYHANTISVVEEKLFMKYTYYP